MWLIPEQNGGNKILIAVGGTGHTYPVAGTYIIGKVNGQDTVLARFLASGAQIGQDGDVRMIIDEDSFSMMDSHDTEFAHIGSPIGTQITDTFVYSNSSSFTLSETPNGTVTVKINNVTTSSFTLSGKALTITTTLTEGDTVSAQYETSAEIKYYTMGTRRGDAGNLSMAEGYQITASGVYSHAEGYRTTASGMVSHAEGLETVSSGTRSHAEGYSTKASGLNSHAEGQDTKAVGSYSHAEGVGSEANGYNSHAQGFYTKANGNYQTAMGSYNDPTNNMALYIGNGSSNSARSNALTVDWDGNVDAKGSVVSDTNFGDAWNDNNGSGYTVSNLSLAGSTYLGQNIRLEKVGNKHPIFNGFDINGSGTARIHTLGHYINQVTYNGEKYWNAFVKMRNDNTSAINSFNVTVYIAWI